MYQYQKILAANDIYSYRRYLQKMLVIVGLLLLSLVSGSGFAAIGKAPSCPDGDKMYYIGSGSPDGTTTSTRKVLSTWTSGLEKKFDFDNGLELSFSFEKYIRSVSGYPKYVANDSDNTIGAIVMEHTSQKEDENHTLWTTINKPVTKYGFVVQDIDYLNSSASYRETFKIVAPSDGQLSNINTTFHTILNNKASAVNGSNCNASRNSNRCDINVDWQNKSANTIFKVSHGNDSPATTQSGGNHAMGYSDFYLCLAPPKLTVKKVLTGNRINNNDQFEIKVTGGSVATNSFTTTGSNADITTGTSDLLSLKQDTTYTITEQVKNGSSIGNIASYDATYSCTNSTTGSIFTTLNGTLKLDTPNTLNSRSFTISNLNYGDEITCTITNTPKEYTFSGTVFNDNGGIIANENTKQNITATFTSNLEYFNGKLDAGESGIYDSALSIRLTDCIGNDGGTNIVTSLPNPQTVSNTITGNYIFNVKPSAIAGKRVCVVESEPASWKDKFYSVDTTANNREVSFATNTYNYGSLDFGEVETNNTALVLIKSQYIHDCNSNLNYANVGDKDIPTNGFSIKPPVTNIEPGKCIAYKIEAYNRGHVALNNIRITDILQKTPVESRFHLPVASGVPATLRKTDQPTSVLINIGDNGVIITAPFELKNTAATTAASKAILYFNTKYGTTIDP